MPDRARAHTHTHTHSLTQWHSAHSQSDGASQEAREGVCGQGSASGRRAVGCDRGLQGARGGGGAGEEKGSAYLIVIVLPDDAYDRRAAERNRGGHQAEQRDEGALTHLGERGQEREEGAEQDGDVESKLEGIVETEEQQRI